MGRKDKRTRERVKEETWGVDVFKLTSLHGKHQGTDAAPQPIICLLPWRLTLRAIWRETVAFVYVLSICSSMQTTYKRSRLLHSTCVCTQYTHVGKLERVQKESSLIRLKYIYVHVYVQSVSVHSLAQMCRLTFVEGGVVDTEISVPDDGQLHGKTAHLHPTVEVLLPWQPQSESEKGDKLVSYFEMVYYLSWLCYHSIHLKHTVKRWQQEHR